MKTKITSGIVLTLLITALLPLALNIHLVESNPDLLFSDDFNDGVADGWTEHLGTWSVVSGEYFVSVGIVENGISTVDSLTSSDARASSTHETSSIKYPVSVFVTCGSN